MPFCILYTNIEARNINIYVHFSEKKGVKIKLKNN